MLSVLPFSVGFLNGNNQSNYYPGEEVVVKEDIAAIAKVMEKHSTEPEDT